MTISLWNNSDRKVILASGSPRRKQILSQMGISFECITPEEIDESSFIDPYDLEHSMRSLSFAKANSISGKYPESLILGADTEVVKNNHVFGKPIDDNDARKMLRLLSGDTHQVTTAVSLVCKETSFEASVAVTTQVTFRHISDEEIEWYLNKREHLDKAGSYGIQGSALIFIEKISGCFFNVVGLPVTGVIELLRKYHDRKEKQI